MRTPDDLAAEPKPLRHRGRVWLIVVSVALVVILGSLRSLAGLWTDQMWFSAVGQGATFTTLLSVKIGLLLVFGVTFFLGLWVNLVAVHRIGATAVLVDPEDEMVRRYQLAVRPYAGRLNAALAIILGLAAGAGTIGQWRNYLLFSHAQSFGTKDPQFGKDVGFYIFNMPFLQFLVSWLLVSTVVITIITGIFHYLNGGIRGQRVTPRVRPAVKIHLSILLAVIAGLKAAGYLLAQWALTTSTNGYVEGATYTDVHARIPAIQLLFWISLLAAVILLINIWRQGWTLPILAVGLWAFVALVIGVIFPALIQTLKVTPSQSTLERPYISRNIDATRQAFGLTNVAKHSFAGSQPPSSEVLQANASTLANVRLWDPDPQISLVTFQKLQGLRSYYTFPSVGVDRYTVDGKLTPTLSGVRQLNAQGLPAASWVNTHLEFTHGTGMAIAKANRVLANGNPEFSVANVPPTSTGGLPAITQSGVFFGQNNPGYVVANSKQTELDFQKADGVNVESHYRGTGGVELNGFMRRAAFALRLGDFNLLISNLVTPKSRIMFVRDVAVMAQKSAPFLSFDSNPYSVLIDGKINWVLDGYTTSAAYPYGESISSMKIPQGTGLPDNYNYVRNSVKVVIDAYSGKMTYYVIDQKDPIIRAYAAAFPDLLTPGSKLPAALRMHLRYPEDIFSAQTAAFGRYHITDAASFYNAGDAWNISQTAGAGSPGATLALTQSVNAQGFVINGPAQRMQPIYQVNALPGTSEQTLTVTEAYVPASNSDHSQNLSAFMVGTSDPSNYGKLNVYVTPSGQNVIGPVVADAEIQSSSKVSSIITPLDQHGSNVILGNVLMIPVNQSMLYVRPLYVTSSGNPLPQLRYVIAVFNSNVSIKSSLDLAVSDVLETSISLPNGQVGSPDSSGGTSGGGGGTTTVPTGIKALLTQADAAYVAAQAALKTGDLAGYQASIETMYQLLVKAEAQASEGTSSSGSSTAVTTTTKPAAMTTTSKPTTTTTRKKATGPIGPSPLRLLAAGADVPR
ncbi:MAG: UPF0182 family protein [Actinomycetes bacterium]